MNNGGRVHRRLKGTQGVYRELARAGFPTGYQVLCFNCNLARGFYGACPHGGAIAARPIANGVVATDQDDNLYACTKCGVERPVAAFYANPAKANGRQSWCGQCTRTAALARLTAARRDALVHYSSGSVRCACCGEDEEKFLALDHVDGAGPRPPGVRRGGNTFYLWLEKQGFPPGLRVLCHNCNCAIGRERECPHAHSRAA